MDGRRAGSRHGVAATLIAAAGLFLAGAAEVAPQQARDAEAAHMAAMAESKRLAQARVASAAALRSLEQATADAAAQMDALAKRRAEAEARLQTRAKALTPLLPLLERLSLFPAETLLAAPAPPEQTIGGLLVLRGMTRQIEAEAEAIRTEQAELDRLGNQLAAQERALAAAQAAQAAQAAGLDRQIAEAQRRGVQTEDAAVAAERHAAQQAAQAESLRGALSQLEAARRQAEAAAHAQEALAARRQQEDAAAQARQREVALRAPGGPGLGAALGQLGNPVAGAVVHAFGEPGDGGPASGISFAAPPAARVTAPCGGRVVFAAPFRSYGQLMIIDCGGGYHFVLAGMDRLDVPVGRSVEPGEPVGVMAAYDPRTGASRPTLYVELRQHGQPINPAPYLRGRS